MTTETMFRQSVEALEALARSNGETDFADLLNAYRRPLAMEVRDSEECRNEAWAIREEADRVANRFENAADALDSYSRERV